MIYSRITHERRFDPAGETWSDWAPRVENPDWRDYFTALAAAAEQRGRELGKQVAAQQPGWAVEAFGSPPDSRHEWTSGSSRRGR